MISLADKWKRGRGGNVFRWLKKNTIVEKPAEPAPSLHRERRQYARIRFPRVGGKGGLPQIFFDSSEIRSINLSMGGLLINDTVFASVVIGTMCEFTFKWLNPPREIQQKARLVRVSSGGWHFKFEDLNPQLLVNLSMAVKPGVRAQAMVLSPEPPRGGQVREHWKSSGGDQILFMSEDPELPEARIKFLPRELHFDLQKGLLIGEKAPADSDYRFEKEAPAWLLFELITFVTNMSNPSKRVMALLSHLEKRV